MKFYQLMKEFHSVVNEKNLTEKIISSEENHYTTLYDPNAGFCLGVGFSNYKDENIFEFSSKN